MVSIPVLDNNKNNNNNHNNTFNLQALISRKQIILDKKMSKNETCPMFHIIYDKIQT